jgi:hypothetical protein
MTGRARSDTVRCAMPNDSGDAGKVLTFYFTHEELAAIQEAADERGLKRNAMVRQMVNDWLLDAAQTG